MWASWIHGFSFGRSISCFGDLSKRSRSPKGLDSLQARGSLAHVSKIYLKTCPDEFNLQMKRLLGELPARKSHIGGKWRFLADSHPTFWRPSSELYKFLTLLRSVEIADTISIHSSVRH